MQRAAKAMIEEIEALHHKKVIRGFIGRLERPTPYILLGLGKPLINEVGPLMVLALLLCWVKVVFMLAVARGLAGLYQLYAAVNGKFGGAEVAGNGRNREPEPDLGHVNPFIIRRALGPARLNGFDGRTECPVKDPGLPTGEAKDHDTNTGSLVK
jgi:hypothetical protein